MFNLAFAGDLPVQGTEIAARWDTLYNFLFWISLLFFVGVVGAMIQFAIQYRHQLGHKPKYITGSHLLEGIFIVIPTVLLLMIFGWGYSVYHSMTQAPTDAYEVRVIGKQWLWQFQYDNGRTTVNELYAPMNRPVKLIMTSEDVLHSFFVPNFRIKQDVVPGMYTSVWFEARVPGKHQVFCAEYCGTSHSGMLAQVVILNDEQWKQWNEGKKFKLNEIPVATDEILGAAEPSQSTEPSSVDRVKTAQAAPDKGVQLTTLAQHGKTVYETKGCVACHSVDGSRKVGPTHKGLFGKKEELTDGSLVLVDENYLRESIEKPQAKLVKGYSPVMPTFQGLISELEMNELIAYIKSLR